ncbi:hypothetical protein T265_03062 [Opisthorchis viverrini]|uniref:protein-tyrosine-phosphatase n=1 Tax=Opisthorchis viverrini TaxID=6198 RepID=A0A074ZT48_OPIVI|nr:hypothetical protein T265_03062 [Opisthorchis viverrini]KER30588.1 hypothetical protein T265_03062 [Opisthorchis viverrini]
MQQTVSHFWLMIWERRSPAIIMLNRIFEKGIMRCYPYFPQEGGPSCLNFTDVNLRVRLEEESTTQLFTKRVLQLIHIKALLATYSRVDKRKQTAADASLRSLPRTFSSPSLHLIDKSSRAGPALRTDDSVRLASILRATSARHIAPKFLGVSKSILELKCFKWWLKRLECEFTGRKVLGSNPTSASRLPPSRLGQPGSISALLNDFFEHRHPDAFNFGTLKQAGQQAALDLTLDSLGIDVCCVSKTSIQDASTVVKLTTPSVSARFRLRTSGDSAAAAVGLTGVTIVLSHWLEVRTNLLATERLADPHVRRTYLSRLPESLPKAAPSDTNSYWDEIATSSYSAGNSACDMTPPDALKHWTTERTVALLTSRRNIPALMRRIIRRQVKTGERHQLIHMHYTSWPDFGVPKSPSGMLNFLWAVRATDALSDAEHPAVVHCSAGVGRSGTFVLIDLALHLVETRGTMKGLDLSQLFVKLRRCRMGVIQTADQLRFCYSAVIRGSEALLRTPVDGIPYIKFEPQPDENDQSAGSSDSDDVWDGLEGGENGSSSEEGFDQVEDAEDLVQDVEEVCEEDPLREVVLLERTPLGASDSTTTECYNRHTISPRTNHAWLYTSPEHGALRNTTPVRVGPREPSLSLGVWNDRLSPIVGSDRYSDHMGIGGRFRRPELIDHSNNALPDTMMDDEPEVPVRRVIQESPLADYPQIASVSYSSSSSSTGSTASNDVSSKPDGDGSSNLREAENQVTEPPETDVHMQDVEVDPLTSEYLATAYALQRRRDVRRQRQVRLQDQMEQVQLLMRESNLERKRWIPVNISRHLRRFFAESGIVQSTQGAALSSAAVLLLAVGFALAGYHYYFGVI